MLPRLGPASIVEEIERKFRAFDPMIERVDPDRRERRPNARQEIEATTVIGRRIAQASAKTRAMRVAHEKADPAPPVLRCACR